MAVEQSTQTQSSARTNNTIRVIKFGVIALVVATIGNLVIREASIALFSIGDQYIVESFAPLSMTMVVVNTLIAITGATIVYLLLLRFTSRPNKQFTRVALVALAASFVMFTAPDLAGAPTMLFASLGAMHVVTAIVAIGALTRMGPSNTQDHREP